MQESTLCAILAVAARPLIWVIFFSCFLNLSYLAAPLYMTQVYDRVMRSQSMPTLFYLTVAITMAYTAFAILEAVRGYILTSVSDIVEDALAARLMQSATSPISSHDYRTEAGHIGRDLDIVRQFASGAAILAFIDLPWGVLYLATLFMMHWLLGAFAVLTSLGLLGLSVVSECATRGPMAQASLSAGRAYQFGDAVARHPDSASTMDLGRGLAARWRSSRAQMLVAQNRASHRALTFGAVARFLRMFTQSTILGVGAYLAINHEISGGAIFAGSLLLGRCIAPVEAILASWRSTLAARDAWARIRMVVARHPSDATRLPSPSGRITLENLSWTPHAAVRSVLHKVTLKIDSGAVLAVVGPNAAGKSTLGRVLAGAIRVEEGVVRLDSSEYSAWDSVQLGRAVGYLPQNYALFPGTIRDNIGRFAAVEDAEVVAAAQAAMAHEMIIRLPAGYDTLVGDGCHAISGGQKQRVALARAMMWNPAVLILDEPTANLDAEGEAALIECVKAARGRGTTVVVITHNTALVRVADSVATMVDGRLVRVQSSTDFLRIPVLARAGA